MQEEFLYSYLLGDAAIRIACILDAFGLTLQSGYLDIRLQDRLVAYYPDHLIHNTTLVQDRLVLHLVSIA